MSGTSTNPRRGSDITEIKKFEKASSSLRSSGDPVPEGKKRRGSMSCSNRRAVSLLQAFSWGLLLIFASSLTRRRTRAAEIVAADLQDMSLDFRNEGEDKCYTRRHRFQSALVVQRSILCVRPVFSITSFYSPSSGSQSSHSTFSLGCSCERKPLATLSSFSFNVGPSSESDWSQLVDHSLSGFSSPFSPSLV